MSANFPKVHDKWLIMQELFSIVGGACTKRGVSAYSYIPNNICTTARWNAIPLTTMQSICHTPSLLLLVGLSASFCLHATYLNVTSTAVERWGWHHSWLTTDWPRPSGTKTYKDHDRQHHGRCTGMQAMLQSLPTALARRLGFNLTAHTWKVWPVVTQDGVATWSNIVPLRSAKIQIRGQLAYYVPLWYLWHCTCPWDSCHCDSCSECILPFPW